MGYLKKKMGKLSSEETEARCFGCGRYHNPRTSFDLLCDECSNRKKEVSIPQKIRR